MLLLRIRTLFSFVLLIFIRCVHLCFPGALCYAACCLLLAACCCALLPSPRCARLARATGQEPGAASALPQPALIGPAATDAPAWLALLRGDNSGEECRRAGGASRLRLGGVAETLEQQRFTDAGLQQRVEWVPTLIPCSAGRCGFISPAQPSLVCCCQRVAVDYSRRRPPCYAGLRFYSI